MKKISFLLLVIVSVSCSTNKPVQLTVNDSNTPLHLMKPDYKTPYGIVDTVAVKQTLNRVLGFLEKATPMRVLDKTTNTSVTDYGRMDKNSVLERGQFRLTSYEWGVTFMALLLVAVITCDAQF